MATFIGVDGIPGGWVAVYLTDADRWFDHSHSLDRLIAVPHERAIIDVPIGLPERGYRKCDQDARKMMGPCVFLGSRWGVWNFASYKEANVYYWGASEKGISKQLWNIRDKLKEVNEAMTPKLQARLMETHPELVFRRLGGGVHLGGKKTNGGRAQRIDLLKDQGFDDIEVWLQKKRRGTGIGRDDLIDACACALVARDGKCTIPAKPPTERGIRMEMWY
jgi:predicted RNase H-like nuclease